MKEELTKAIADGAVTLATSTGILTVTLKMFDHYAAGIGAVSTLFFGLVYIIFQWLAHKKLTLADKNKETLALHIEDVKLLNDKMNVILRILEKQNSQNNDKEDKS